MVFDTNNRVVMWRASATAASGHERMFKTLWFDDNLNGKILKDTTGRAARRPDPDGTDPGTPEGAQATIHDLYDYHQSDNNINRIWQFLTDDDGDLVASAGDLGKVDLLSDSDNPRTADNETTIALEGMRVRRDLEGNDRRPDRYRLRRKQRNRRNGRGRADGQSRDEPGRQCGQLRQCCRLGRVLRLPGLQRG